MPSKRGFLTGGLWLGYVLFTSYTFIKSAKQAKEAEQVIGTLSSLVPGFELMTAVCPICLNQKKLSSQVIHLNDSHKWTREDIADWLETLDHDLRIVG